MDFIRFGVDMGLCVLAWLVQLIIYPSFKNIESKQFLDWHAWYTGKITVVVAPLMFAQLGLYSWQLRSGFDAVTVICAALAFSTWVITFQKAIPLHNKLSKERDESNMAKLVKVNAWRTAVWSAIPLIQLVAFIAHEL